MSLKHSSPTLSRSLQTSKAPFLYQPFLSTTRPIRTTQHHRHSSRTTPSSSRPPPPIRCSPAKSFQPALLTRSCHNNNLSTTTTTPPNVPTPLTPSSYTNLSDNYIDALLTRLESLSESTRPDIDVEYSAGVLTLVLDRVGTYVLNKQPPNRQIWLSSPVSGPKRYDWVAAAREAGAASKDAAGVMVGRENVYGMGAGEVRGRGKGSGEDRGGDGDGGGGGGRGIDAEREGRWVYLRDGSTLTGCLEEEVGFKMDEGGEDGEGWRFDD